MLHSGEGKEREREWRREGVRCVRGRVGVRRSVKGMGGGEDVRGRVGYRV